MNYYFETSAINYFRQKYNWVDATCNKAFQSVRGRRWLLSPVSLWEIFLTKDEVERERLIFFCQHLFYEKLLFAPSEIIIQYINQGCPLVEPRKYIFSRLNLQKTWKDLCENKRKTFVLDYQELRKRTKILSSLSKSMFLIFNKEIIEVNNRSYESQLYEFLTDLLSKIKLKGIDRSRKNDKISLMFIFYILCLGIDLEPSPINDYWNERKMDNHFERLDYILKKYPTLIHRGPFIEMALMARYQIHRKKLSSRGLFFDCLHTIYLPYVDIFITKDTHFSMLKENIDHIIFKKIFHIQEIKIDAYPRLVTTKSD